MKEDIRSALLVVLSAALAVLPAQAAADHATTVVGGLHLTIWNQADQPIRLKVLLDGKPIFNKVIKVGHIYPKIVAHEEFNLMPGKHFVVVRDITRGLEKETEFATGEFANIEVFEDKADLGLQIDYERNRHYR